MKDDKIIKALEYCLAQGITSECERCRDKIGCRDTLLRDALDLINSQKADIEKKDVEIDILIRKKETLKDEIAELQHKNSELEIELKAMRGAVNSYKAEVERLEEEVRLAHNVIKRTFLLKAGLKNDPFAEIRAKERKEFWEQIKARYGLDENDIIVAVNIKEIDNFLAEMEREGE